MDLCPQGMSIDTLQIPVRHLWSVPMNYASSEWSVVDIYGLVRATVAVLLCLTAVTQWGALSFFLSFSSITSNTTLPVYCCLATATSPVSQFQLRMPRSCGAASATGGNSREHQQSMYDANMAQGKKQLEELLRSASHGLCQIRLDLTTWLHHDSKRIFLPLEWASLSLSN